MYNWQPIVIIAFARELVCHFGTLLAFTILKNENSQYY